ncbi:MAG: hypothetical protein WBV82_03355 [Myxococcaceae bacterium]
MLRGVMLFGVMVFLGSCRHTRPEAEPTPIQAGTETKWYSATSNNELKLAEGVVVTDILEKSGTSVGVILRANDGETTSIKCDCIGACSGNCIWERVDDDSIFINTFRCTGSCTSSEQTACGACNILSVQGQRGLEGIIVRPAEPPPAQSP